MAEEDPFAAALSSLENGTAGDDSGDPFEQALAASGAEVKTTDDSENSPAINLDFLMDINLKVSFEVGRTRMVISDLLSLGQGSVIELDRLVGEELRILVNGQLLARGEVVVVSEKFGARITEIVSLEDRVVAFNK